MVTRLALVPPPNAPADARADDTALVDALRRGDRAAQAAMYARDGARVRRVVARILGVGPELDDVVQDAFLAAFRRVGALREATKLRAWLLAVAVGEARHHLRAKRRRAWLAFFAPQDLPDAPATPVDAGASAALRATYVVLDALATDERIAFALRHLEGLELSEAAAIAGVSLATFKRRLKRADNAFAAAARDHPALDSYVQSSQAHAQRDS